MKLENRGGSECDGTVGLANVDMVAVVAGAFADVDVGGGGMMVLCRRWFCHDNDVEL